MIVNGEVLTLSAIAKPDFGIEHHVCGLLVLGDPLNEIQIRRSLRGCIDPDPKGELPSVVVQ